MVWKKLTKGVKKVAKKTGVAYKAIKKEAKPIVKEGLKDAKSVAKAVNDNVKNITGGAGKLLKSGSGFLDGVSGALPLILGTVVVVAGVYAYSNYSSAKRATGQSYRMRYNYMPSRVPRRGQYFRGYKSRYC